MFLEENPEPLKILGSQKMIARPGKPEKIFFLFFLLAKLFNELALMVEANSFYFLI